nr:uncharacterized protein LOC109169488 [Ipomoea batatas]
MSSQYVLASQVSPIHTRRAIRVWLVRTFKEPELHGRATRAKNVSSTTKRLSKESTPMRSISITSIVSQSTDIRDFISGSVVITTIADLYQQTKSGDFYVPVMITGIESSGEWVADASSDAPFLLWDRECTELLGMTADCLYSSYEHENVDVPTELETLIGKAMVFKDESGADEVNSPNKVVLPRKPEGN